MKFVVHNLLQEQLEGTAMIKTFDPGHNDSDQPFYKSIHLRTGDTIGESFDLGALVLESLRWLNEFGQSIHA